MFAASIEGKSYQVLAQRLLVVGCSVFPLSLLQSESWWLVTLAVFHCRKTFKHIFFPLILQILTDFCCTCYATLVRSPQCRVYGVIHANSKLGKLFQHFSRLLCLYKIVKCVGIVLLPLFMLIGKKKLPTTYF